HLGAREGAAYVQDFRTGRDLHHAARNGGIQNHADRATSVLRLQHRACAAFDARGTRGIGMQDGGVGGQAEVGVLVELRHEGGGERHDAAFGEGDYQGESAGVVSWRRFKGRSQEGRLTHKRRGYPGPLHWVVQPAGAFVEGLPEIFGFHFLHRGGLAAGIGEQRSAAGLVDGIGSLLESISGVYAGSLCDEPRWVHHSGGRRDQRSRDAELGGGRIDGGWNVAGQLGVYRRGQSELRVAAVALARPGEGHHHGVIANQLLFDGAPGDVAAGDRFNDEERADGAIRNRRQTPL